MLLNEDLKRLSDVVERRVKDRAFPHFPYGLQIVASV